MFVGSCANGTFYAIDRATGTLRWKHETAAAGSYQSFHGAMVRTADLVIVGNDGVTGSIFAFDAKTGNVRWKYDAGNGGVSLDLLLVPPQVYALTSTQGLLALDAASGRLTWRYAVKPATWASPATDGNCIYVAAADGAVHALNGRNGAVLWKMQLDGTPSNSVAVSNGTLYAGTSSTNWDDPWEMTGGGRHTLYRLSTADGKILSSLRLPAKPLGRPVFARDTILLISGEDLLSADRELKKIQWRTRTPTADQKPRIQLEGDVVYVPVMPHDLVAIDVRDGSVRDRQTAEGPVTTFRVMNDWTVIGAKQKLWAYATK